MNNTRLMVGIIIVLVGTTGFLGGYLLGQQSSGRPPIAHLNAPSMPMAPAVPLPPELVSFLSGWKCPCGQCKDMLVDCQCDMPGGATEIKKFIVEEHKQNVPLEQIREKVIKRWGQSVVGGAM